LNAIFAKLETKKPDMLKATYGNFIAHRVDISAYMADDPLIAAGAKTWYEL
jgi:hypothetical protein